MLARLCQLKSRLLVTLIVLGGCTQIPEQQTRARVELLSTMKNEWFSKNKEHGIWDQKEKAVPHLFFDVDPEFTSSDAMINTVILTPQDSAYGYQLDIVSGQRYYSHSYCPQKDIWNQYKGAISSPTYSAGVIPRFLDQMGEPQKVIVFGGAEKFNRLLNHREHRIRLVGAFIEQTCPVGNCLGKSNWNSRLVFVAVDPEDEVVGQIENSGALASKINWEKNRAVYENLDGRNSGGGISYPAVRAGNLIPFPEALEVYKKHSIVLSGPESNKIRSSCHLLYEKLWADVGVERPEDKPANTTEAVKEKIKLHNELKKQRVSVGFSNRLKVFTKKYFSEFNTCSKFVYAGNINQNPEKFWFLSYLGLYYRLHKDGYFYDCPRKSWQDNGSEAASTQVYDIKQGIESCSDQNIDHAMNTLPNFVTGLKSGERNYQKFIDYDMGKFGTHLKLYSWVKVKARKYDCRYDPNAKIIKEMRAFPEDVSWKPRHAKDKSDELEIIY